METLDENEIPQTLFWRVMIVIRGIPHFVEGFFYHNTVEEALSEWQEIGDTVLHSHGLARKDVDHAAIVERRH